LCVAALCATAAPLIADTTRAVGSIWSLPVQGTAVAARVDDMFVTILWITGSTLAIVFALVLFALVRFRASRSARSSYMTGNTRLEISWAVVSALVLVGLALGSRELWNDIQSLPGEKSELQIELKPRQYQWDIAYAGRDGRAGTLDDVTTINQLHVPVNRRIVLLMRSQDVIHSFFVPAFRLKQDAVPGMTTRYAFTVDRSGTFEIACAELCGLGHYRMKGLVTVHEEAEFERWYRERQEAIARRQKHTSVGVEE